MSADLQPTVIDRYHNSQALAHHYICKAVSRKYRASVERINDASNAPKVA